MSFRKWLYLSLCLGMLAVPLQAQAPSEAGSGSGAASEAETAEPADGAETVEAGASTSPGDASADRTRLDLLREVNSERGEGRRNENVRLTLIDNNVLRELNERLGISATAVKTF